MQIITELFNYISFHRLFRKVRLLIVNTGPVAATDVRLEMSVLKGIGVGLWDMSDAPEKPEARLSSLVTPATRNFRAAHVFRDPGDVEITQDENHFILEIDCGSIQPGRKIWTEEFLIGISESGETSLSGQLFAANMPRPMEFALAIDATIQQSEMTVDGLLALDDEEVGEESDIED